MNELVIEALSVADEYIELASGGRVAFKRCGSGSPVICLHAVGHGSGDFSGLMADLSRDFEVIAMDWPGMGRSSPSSVAVSAEHFGQILLEVVEKLALDRPLVIGNSIGGAAAIHAAAMQPEKFSGLVLCNPGGLGEVNATTRRFISIMVAFFQAGARGARWFTPVFALYYRLAVLKEPSAADRRKLIISASQRLAPLLAEAWFSFSEEKGDLRKFAPDLKLPIWIAWAKSDRIVSWGRSKRAVMTMPDHRISFFRGGHSAFMEDQEAFAASFLAFANGLRL